MTNKRYTALLAMALSLFVGTMMTGVAEAGQTTSQASVFLNAGALSIDVPSNTVLLQNIALNGSQQSITADVVNPITVTDATGYGQGWTLQVNATPFHEMAPSGGMVTGTTAKSLPAGSLTLATDNSITAVGTSSPLPANQMQGVVSVIDTANGSAISVVSAGQGAGMGEYQIGFPANNLTLSLSPATTYVDTVNYPGQPTPYTSTITWQVSSGPANQGTSFRNVRNFSTGGQVTTIQNITLPWDMRKAGGYIWSFGQATTGTVTVEFSGPVTGFEPVYSSMNQFSSGSAYVYTDTHLVNGKYLATFTVPKGNFVGFDNYSGQGVILSITGLSDANN